MLAANEHAKPFVRTKADAHWRRAKGLRILGTRYRDVDIAD